LSTPMAFFSASPFLGPVIGPIIAGFINQHTSWRWTWYVQIIWAFVELLLLVFFVPETYSPKLLQRKARRLRREGGPGSERFTSRLDLEDKHIGRKILFSVTVPFKLVAQEPMALALNIWTSLLLGILYMCA
jgi:MFS family permease